MNLNRKELTKREAEVFFQLFACRSGNISQEEKRLIFAYDMETDSYRRLCLELTFDNDYKLLKKIIFNLKRNSISSAILNKLFKQVIDLFESKGCYNCSEKLRILSLQNLILQHN